MNILYVPSAITGEHSVTRLVGQTVVNSLLEDSTAQLVVRDVVENPLPHFTLAPTDEHKSLSQAVLQEYIAADVVVIGAPMYNFSVPSQLKAWIDNIAVAGVTFRYTAHGPEGLFPNKKIIIVGSQGGIHDASTDFQERYLRQIFAFLGVKNIHVIGAQGVAFGPEHKDKEIARILEQIAQQKCPAVVL